MATVFPIACRKPVLIWKIEVNGIPAIDDIQKANSLIFKLRQETESLKNQNESLVQQAEQLQSKYDEVSKERDEINSECEKLKNKIEELQLQIKSAEEEEEENNYDIYSSTSYSDF